MDHEPLIIKHQECGSNAWPGIGERPSPARAHPRTDRSRPSFREELRRKLFRPGYSGRVHFTSAMVAGILAVGLLLSRVDSPTWLELTAIPLTLLYANLVEYLGHRGPMHRRYRELKLLSDMFQSHAAEHHIFFTRENMTADGHEDWQLILAGPVFLAFFLGFIALPSGVAVHMTTTPNTALLFAITALLYALSYEALHLAYHCPPGSWVGRLPGMDLLRRHHRTHHDPRLMTRYNFNITIPLVDWLAGTWHEEPDEPHTKQMPAP